MISVEVVRIPPNRSTLGVGEGTKWRGGTHYQFYTPPDTWNHRWGIPDYHLRLFICKLR